MRFLVVACCLAFSFALCPFLDPRSLPTKDCPFSQLQTPNATSSQTLGRMLRVDPDPGQGTMQGCQCESSCGATIDDGFRCDWCKTKDKCGDWSPTSGYWDHCLYEGTPEFHALSAQEKTDYFWSQITADRNHGDYPSLTAVIEQDAQTSFHAFQDFMPAGRVKSIHSVGSICQFQLRIHSDSPFTGLFGPGNQKGFIRMGPALGFDKSGDGLVPGIGVKFPRSGIHSGNYVALVSLDIAVWNFWEHDMSNHIGPAASPATKALVVKFLQASSCPLQVALGDMATYRQDGTKERNVKVPFKLFIVPSDEVQRPSVPKSLQDLLNEFASYTVGTPIAKVYACGKGAGEAENDPTFGGVEKACGAPYLLGEMVTTSVCTSSIYGDNRFFFQHQPIEQDWKTNPEFLTQFDSATACDARNPLTPDDTPERCGS